MYRKERNYDDVKYVLEHLRDEDRHEAVIQKGENYVEECLKDIMASKGKVILGCTKKDDTPVCVGGVSEYDKDIGVVWLLCTPEIVEHQICILRNLKQEFREYEKKYLMMCNIIYKENYLAKNWLKKFGFKFENIFNVKLPEGFEFFYKKKSLRGLSKYKGKEI